MSPKTTWISTCFDFLSWAPCLHVPEDQQIHWAAIQRLVQDGAVVQPGHVLMGLHIHHSGPCVCPFLLKCLQMCQQHTACQGSTMETLQRLSLIFTLPYAFSLHFFDSRGDFCLICEEKKKGSSLQHCFAAYGKAWLHKAPVSGGVIPAAR